MKKIKNILLIFWTFFKIGAFTFGGGHAMIPLIQKEAVEKKKWISEDNVLEIVTIAESTPGPIAINAATFVGYRVCGFWGAFAGTLGIVLPSFVIILVISSVLNRFREIEAVRYAFNGIRAGVLALIIRSLWSMYKKCPKNAASYITMSAAFILTAFLKVNVLAVLIACAIFGLVSSTISAGRNKL